MDKLKLSAYEIIEVRKIADIESMGYILRHKKAEHACVSFPMKMTIRCFRSDFGHPGR